MNFRQVSIAAMLMLAMSAFAAAQETDSTCCKDVGTVQYASSWLVPTHAPDTAVLFAPSALVQDPVTAGGQRADQAVERTVRRYHIGVRGGIGIDPELLSVGAQATFGPFFTRRISFRPGADLQFGEVTTQFDVDLDGIYTFSANTTRGPWSPYVGAGPTFAVRHISFEGETDGNRFDFGDFDWETGLNFVVGVENRRGAFIEMKATGYSSPHVRVLVGINF